MSMGILKLVVAAGSKAELARILGVSRQAIHQWHRQGYVPIGRAKEIQKHFDIRVSEIINPRFLTAVKKQKDVV